MSSGKPITLPIYAFTTTYSGTGTPTDIWNYSTVRSETDLSSEDESIIYSNVKVSQTGVGSILYQYSIPATNWDSSVSPDWAPTINYFARASCSAATYGKNDIYSYPFAPNINYDFERGLLKQVINYNQAGQKVSESDYTYTRSGTPVAITALKIDYNKADMVYAKYKIFTTCSELATQVTNKMFDPVTQAQQQTSATNYSYTSTQHKKLTQVTATNSDGSISTQKTTYIKDFTIPPSTTDINLLAMKGLQQQNVNIPVETQYQVQHGATTKTIGANLSTFYTVTSTYGPTYLLSQKRLFVSGAGVTDFSPATISSNVFSADSRYVVKENYTAYDGLGFLLTKDDNNKNEQTIITDHTGGLPIAQVNNATWNEFVLSGFELSSPAGINGIQINTSAGTYTSTTNARTGVNALTLKVGDIITASSIHKNAQSNNYVFSCWVNPNATSPSTLTVVINSGGTNTNYTITIPAGTGGWNYYERKIPVSAVASTFNMSVKSSAQIDIDDVLFYPEVATISTFTYDPVSRLKVSETNSNGVSTYYTYDRYGRVLHVLDQDKNIVLSKTYLKYGESISSVNPYISPSYLQSQYAAAPYAGRPINFKNNSNVDPIVTDAIYTWDYGDGTTETSSTKTDGVHTYTTAGTYTVTLTINSATYGLESYTQDLNITVPNATLQITTTNYSTGGNINNIKFYQQGQLIYIVPGTLSTPLYIAPDKYDIKVSTSGNTSNFTSVTFTGTTKTCTGNDGTGAYNFYDDLSSSTHIDFTIDILPCGSTGQHQ